MHHLRPNTLIANDIKDNFVNGLNYLDEVSSGKLAADSVH